MGVLLLEPPKVAWCIPLKLAYIVVHVWYIHLSYMYGGFCACAADDASSESECIVVCVYYGTYHNGVFYLAHREYYLVDVNLQWGDICHVCSLG